MQDSRLFPQMPAGLQQLPQAEPLHVCWLRAPHMRFLLTLRPAAEEVAAGADEVRVLVAVARVLVLVLVVTGRVDVATVVGAAVEGAAVEAAALEDTGAADDAPEDPAQFPNRGLQPVPQ